MEAARVLAGFSMGEADLLRRAMGKKIKSEMDAQRAGFVEGCERVNAIPAAKANELFDLIDKFAGYGFNSCHAAPYALLAYQTAWLKRAPSGRILRRLDVLRHRRRPTSSPSSSTTCGGWTFPACRRRSTPAKRTSRSRKSPVLPRRREPRLGPCLREGTVILPSATRSAR